MSHTVTCAGSNAPNTASVRSRCTAPRSTVFRLWAVKAATIASALYRDRLNRWSTARCTRRRSGLNSAATTSVAGATATGVCRTGSTWVASSTSPTNNPAVSAVTMA